MPLHSTFNVGPNLTIRLYSPMLQNQTPMLENATTMVIQAMDLSLIVPLAVLSGILLLRRSTWGYQLSSVTLLKGVTLGLGVSAMAINMALRGGQPGDHGSLPRHHRTEHCHSRAAA